MNDEHSVPLEQQVTLLELVDRVLNKGVVLSGDITLSVAGVDLVYLSLRVLLASAASLDRLALTPSNGVDTVGGPRFASGLGSEGES